MGWVRSKQAIGLGVVEGEAGVGLAHGGGLVAQVVGGVVGGLQRGGETLEAVGAHRRQDVVLVAEVPVGGHGADAQLGGQLAHGHRVGAVLGEKTLGGLAQAVA